MGENFDSWAMVEIFGHKRTAGRVSEQEIAGKGFIRVDVPGVNGQKPYTKFFGASAIYGITPTDEAHATAAAETWQPRPVGFYEIKQITDNLADHGCNENEEEIF